MTTEIVSHYATPEATRRLAVQCRINRTPHPCPVCFPQEIQKQRYQRLLSSLTKTLQNLHRILQFVFEDNDMPRPSCTEIAHFETRTSS